MWLNLGVKTFKIYQLNESMFALVFTEEACTVQPKATDLLNLLNLMSYTQDHNPAK